MRWRVRDQDDKCYSFLWYLTSSEWNESIYYIYAAFHVSFVLCTPVSETIGMIILSNTNVLLARLGYDRHMHNTVFSSKSAASECWKVYQFYNLASIVALKFKIWYYVYHKWWITYFRHNNLASSSDSDCACCSDLGLVDCAPLKSDHAMNWHYNDCL